MEKRIKAYLIYMEKRLEQLEKEKASSAEIETVKKEHLQQISFFQHERLIHLLVTITFALLELLSLIAALLVQELSMMLLTGVLLILLVPYIRHYYILENAVQKMYGQYDRLCHLQEE